MTEAHNTLLDPYEQAAEWFIRVRARNADPDVHAQWLCWIEADPRHRAAFEEIQQTWDAVGEIKETPWPHTKELLVSSLRPEEGHRAARVNRKRRFIVPAGLAAALLSCVACLLLLRQFDTPERITTARGEQQSAVLPDGSRIELGAATGVVLEFTEERRLIKADEGEVFYNVEHDADRPFIVKSGPVTVTAIGTAFAVRREGETVSVTVAQGVVDVKSAVAHSGQTHVRARAGQRVSFDQGRLSTAPDLVQERAATWRRGRLRFENDPLRVVVASLSRYSSKEIVLGDPALAELRFTGTVFDDSTEDWVDAAGRLFPVTVDYSDPKRIVIRARE